MDNQQKQRLISLLDLTRLSDNDNITAISKFCRKAQTPLGNVAAVCLYPEFIKTAKQALTDTPIATVANFPTGDDGLEAVDKSILTSLNNGANEIDVVLPYQRLIAADIDHVRAFLAHCRDITRGFILKVIIETAILDDAHIAGATQLVADAGADFVKTSTGKAGGASIAAVTTILETLLILDNPPGIKISGGIRTPEQAQTYLDLIEAHMGEGWISANKVRFGASQLIDAL